MIPSLSDLVWLLVGFAAGMAVLWFVRSRPVTTKSMLLQAAAADLTLIAKMSGASDSLAQAQSEAAAEVAAQQKVAAALAKLTNVQP